MIGIMFATMGRWPAIAAGSTPAPIAAGSTLDEALWSHVLGDANVSAIIGQRFFPDAIPQNEQIPAAVYQQISSVADETLDGASGLTFARYQISAWAATRREAKTLAEAIRFRLQSFRGDMGDVSVQDVSLIDRRDGYEPAVQNAQQSRHGVQLDFQIWFTETVPTH